MRTSSEPSQEQIIQNGRLCIAHRACYFRTVNLRCQIFFTSLIFIVTWTNENILTPSFSQVTVCLVVDSCVHRRVVEGSEVGSAGCVVHVDVHGEVSYVVGGCNLIGASLSEPHTSESNGGIFIYIYIYILHISVVHRSVNGS